MRRNLDGYYFRVLNEETGKYENICFSDLTEEQMYEVMDGKDERWLKSLAAGLGITLRGIGEIFGIEMREDE